MSERLIPLEGVLKAVDEWLKSDDTWVTDKDGNKIEGGLIDVKKGALLTRLLKDR